MWENAKKHLFQAPKNSNKASYLFRGLKTPKRGVFRRWKTTPIARQYLCHHMPFKYRAIPYILPKSRAGQTRVVKYTASGSDNPNKHFWTKSFIYNNLTIVWLSWKSFYFWLAKWFRNSFYNNRIYLFFSCPSSFPSL